MALKNYLKPLLVGLLSLAIAKVCLDLWHMLLFESTGVLNSDVLIYLTVGRGILKGLHPYTDLFENKPLGIFYISAASLWLTGGTLLMRIVQAVGLLFVPIGLAVYAWFQNREDRFMFVASAFIFGGLIALRAEENAGSLQSEIFGLIPITLYAISINWKPMNWRQIVCAGVCILGAVAIREPYILGIIGASLLSSRTIREFRDSFLFPFVLATVLGLLLLFLFGALNPYIHVYLPGMFSNRIQGDALGPLYLRALWVNRFFSSLTIFSSMPIFGYVIGLLWVLAIISKEKMDDISIALTFGAAIVGAIGLNEIFVLLTLFYKASVIGLTPWMVLNGSSFRFIALAYLLGGIIYACLLVLIGKRNWRIVVALIMAFLAILSLSLSAGIGGYVWNYMLFSLPALITIFLLLPKRFCPLIAICLVVSSLAYKEIDTNKFSASPPEFAAAAKQDSLVLDHLMDACHFDRYVYGGIFPTFAFAEHSPVGPIFTPYNHDYLGFDHPLYQETFRAALNSPVLIEPIKQLNPHDPFPREVRDGFSTSVPACAKGIVIPEFRVFYRS